MAQSADLLDEARDLTEEANQLDKLKEKHERAAAFFKEGGLQRDQQLTLADYCRRRADKKRKRANRLWKKGQRLEKKEKRKLDGKAA